MLVQCDRYPMSSSHRVSPTLVTGTISQVTLDIPLVQVLS